MFTPPPSPLPPKLKDLKRADDGHDGDEPTTAHHLHPSISPNEAIKRTSARRLRWMVMLVPLALILITLSTQYLAHPVAFDIFLDSPPDSNWSQWKSALIDWRTHEYHKHKRQQAWASDASSSTIISFPTAPIPSSTSTTAPSTTTGTVLLPTIPATPPVLPTPFPQPFDTSLTKNFSTQSCYNFFVNMTNTASFRSCRPFSLLLLSSTAFIQDQDNITDLNNVIWGTCNTTPGQNQCVDNMAWFASTLQTSCEQDITDRNSFAVTALQALQAYSLMSNTGCLADPTTNSYCYVEAVSSTSPSDLYFYQLPLGISLPNSTSPSCSSCTKSMMGLYFQALTSQPSGTLSGLVKTYEAAAQLAVRECGDGYAILEKSAAGRLAIGGMVWVGIAGLVVMNLF